MKVSAFTSWPESDKKAVVSESAAALCAPVQQHFSAFAFEGAGKHKRKQLAQSQMCKALAVRLRRVLPPRLLLL